MIRTCVAVLLACLALVGCGQDIRDPLQQVAARSYTHDGPPSLTLYTVTRADNGAGAHTGLMINGAERVLFDPAGSFRMPGIAPERGDTVYGITEKVKRVYIDFHARETYDVNEQTIEVSPEVAAMALRLARQNGAVGPARCTVSVSRILGALPGFEQVRPVWLPTRLMRQLSEMPGVQTRVITDDDAGDNDGVLIEARDLFADFPDL